jgi:hypothetical protein
MQRARLRPRRAGSNVAFFGGLTIVEHSWNISRLGRGLNSVKSMYYLLSLLIKELKKPNSTVDRCPMETSVTIVTCRDE